ncbi:MAG: hypothetical protein JMN24_15755 [gamma proteobacterium endosymbiont of Lamellibrachia anaximandri]|nr:hypothetical protein [gamma proteobacterium endosymbiont of Lamellibrachia anaximandri]MBL3618347.1 hypothetical protein [gamma proteobacterium endosymbiont of Lamellibrachia anaximandri]
MKYRSALTLCVYVALLLSIGNVFAGNTDDPTLDYLSARWNPLHFKPAIDYALDAQCLGCHQEVLERKPLSQSPAGIKSSESLAWYQKDKTYQGEQDTFHRRHMVTGTAKRLMKFKCNTCHQGHDPKDEASGTTDTTQKGLVLRKTVNPDICLMCHGKFDYKVMAGLTGDWAEVADTFNGDCVTCHKEFRTKRHKLNFLNEKEIEKAGEEDSNTCYGCHGGRAWYAIAYPYVRRAWLKRMPGALPEWAKDRPTEYTKRFTK